MPERIILDLANEAAELAAILPQPEPDPIHCDLDKIAELPSDYADPFKLVAREESHYGHPLALNRFSLRIGALFAWTRRPALRSSSPLFPVVVAPVLPRVVSPIPERYTDDWPHRMEQLARERAALASERAKFWMDCASRWQSVGNVERADHARAMAAASVV